MKGEKVCIFGSGIVGRSWAMIFASAEYSVSLYDINEKQIQTALESINQQLHELENNGNLRGKTSADHQVQLISATTDIVAALKGAKYCQECVPDDLELKKRVHSQIDETADEETIVGSSSSYLSCSLISEHLRGRHRVTIAHPINPPYFVPLVEISPAPWTDHKTVVKARALMEEIGQAPVTLKKEVTGFAINRLQVAILNECYRLVADGVMNVKDVDTVMHSGLGPRYAFIGPLTVAHLNADGMMDYIDRYGHGITRTGKSLGPDPEWSNNADGAKQIVKELDELIPHDTLTSHRSKRDGYLAELVKLKKCSSDSK